MRQYFYAPSGRAQYTILGRRFRRSERRNLPDSQVFPLRVTIGRWEWQWDRRWHVEIIIRL